MTLDRWTALMIQFQLGDNKTEYEYLTKKHKEKHRAYHNVTHVQDCLSKLDSLGQIENKKELEIALWYHDVIYNPYGKDNEIKSAEKASIFFKKNTLEKHTTSLVNKLIIATIHKEAPANDDEAYIMDIDISILGSAQLSYEKYTQQIRQEYKLVPSFIYRKNRMKIMKMFLNRKHLYYTKHFRELYEDKARENIEREIDSLIK